MPKEITRRTMYAVIRITVAGDPEEPIADYAGHDGEPNDNMTSLAQFVAVNCAYDLEMDENGVYIDGNELLYLDEHRPIF